LSLLLDTHVWIWSQECPEKLGPKAVASLTASETTLQVSTISTLEIARLVALGFIELERPLQAWVGDTLDALRCSAIEISHDVAIGAYTLHDDFHKDPADRILVATARRFDLVLLTADEKIIAYPHVRSQDARR
jgi:PIN domain nuclease of toxin-antitoxin system